MRWIEIYFGNPFIEFLFYILYQTADSALYSLEQKTVIFWQFASLLRAKINATLQGEIGQSMLRIFVLGSVSLVTIDRYSEA